jgi:hypothetical protein
MSFAPRLFFEDRKGLDVIEWARAKKMHDFLQGIHSRTTGLQTGQIVVNFATTGGTLFSYGDNDIDGNTNNNTAALTPLAMH